MRTLTEILDAAKTGGEWPTHEECFWAVQALEQAWMMTARNYRNSIHKPRAANFEKMFCDEDFTRSKRCLGTDPKIWLGPSRDFSKPENRERRDAMISVYEKLVKRADERNETKS